MLYEYLITGKNTNNLYNKQLLKFSVFSERQAEGWHGPAWGRDKSNKARQAGVHQGTAQAVDYTVYLKLNIDYYYHDLCWL